MQSRPDVQDGRDKQDSGNQERETVTVGLSQYSVVTSEMHYDRTIRAVLRILQFQILVRKCERAFFTRLL